MTEEKKMKKKQFGGRALVSALASFSFIVLVVTGLILFITPPGRVANWTGWRFLGLTKDQWGATHIWFALTFLIVSGFHIYLNWRPLLNHFKSRLTRKFAFRLEWMVALALCVVIYTGTIGEVPPFSSLVAWNETIKDSWEEKDRRPPVPHAELLSLEELASKTGADLDAILETLKAKNIHDATGQSILGELAEEHGMTPDALYNIAVSDKATGEGERGSQSGMRSGGGLGRLTLEQFCAGENLDLAQVLAKLRAVGINADADMTLREIADRNDIKPPELVEMLKKQ